jgi:septal ring factor EnvC (AmiA/AmiB activator)
VPVCLTFRRAHTRSPHATDRHPGVFALGSYLLPVMLMLALAFPTSVLHAGEAEEQAGRLQQLRERIGNLKNQLGDLLGQQAALQRELAATEKAIGRTAAGMRELQQDENALQARLDALQKVRGRHRKALQEMRAGLAKDLRSAYLMGRQEQIKLMLNQEDPATFSRVLAYHGYFTRSRSERIQNMRDTLDALAATGAEITAQQQRLQALLGQQQEAAGQLAEDQAERARVLAKLQAQLRDKSQELAQLERDEQRLHELVESLQQALRDIPAAATDYRSLDELKGKLRWPVAGRISMQYGARQAGGKLKSRGVRISAPAGAEVRAIAKGRVAYADWLRGFGLLLIVDQGKNYMSLYGNNRALFKEVGEWVEGGEVIATVGNSGGQSSAGLYLELRKKGRPFNPAPWFAGKPAAARASR